MSAAVITAARQPFAPLDSTRLQALTSTKNKQNVAILNTPSKRKAAVMDNKDEDTENVDPVQFSKRLKGLANGITISTPTFDLNKPGLELTIKSPTSIRQVSAIASRPILQSRRRSLLNRTTKPLTSQNSSTSKFKLGNGLRTSSPLARSSLSTSAKLLGAHITRVDPPNRTLPTTHTPLSLDAALKGTLTRSTKSSGLANSTATETAVAADTKGSRGKPDVFLDATSVSKDDMPSSWFFDIHEDTPEQEMTNLLQHSTCVLDISSDEETEEKRLRAAADGSDKENVPPPGHQDVTPQLPARSTSAAARRGLSPTVTVATADVMEPSVVDPGRSVLGELDVRDYYAPGCDSSSVFVVPADEAQDQDDDDSATVVDEAAGAVVAVPVSPKAAELMSSEVPASIENGFEEAPMPAHVPTVEEIMAGPTPRTPLPIETLIPVEISSPSGSFELWESGSAKDEAEKDL